MEKSIMGLTNALSLGVATAQKIVLKNTIWTMVCMLFCTMMLQHNNLRDVSCSSKMKTGQNWFAHFSLLFEGTKNIKRGEWFKIVSSNGGVNNATSDDRTYYYEVFPSNLELALWMESERLMHPIINQIGSYKTGLLKKKNSRYDNQPWQNFTYCKGKYV
jgi:predicted Zn-dependent peptidase